MCVCVYIHFYTYLYKFSAALLPQFSLRLPPLSIPKIHISQNFLIFFLSMAAASQASLLLQKQLKGILLDASFLLFSRFPVGEWVLSILGFGLKTCGF